MGYNFLKAPDPGLRFPGGSAARRARAKKAWASWAVALWRVRGSGFAPLSAALWRGERSRTQCCGRKPCSALSRARRAATGPHHGRERECLLARRPHPGLPVLRPPLPAAVWRPPARRSPQSSLPASLSHPCPRLPAAVPSVLLSPARLLGFRGVGDRASGPWLRLGVLWCAAPPRRPFLRSRFSSGSSGLSRVRTWRAGRGRREVASPRGWWGSRSARVELSSDVLSGAGGELRAQRGM